MYSRVRVIVVEDDEEDFGFIGQEFHKSGFSPVMERVTTRESLVLALDSFAPDIVLCDYRLPFFDGMTALSVVRERKPDLPFIFVSGMLGEEIAVEAMKNGATDYVLKNNLNRLVPSVNRALREKKQNEELYFIKTQLQVIHEEFNTLVYKTSHALRGPVTSILGLTDLAVNENDAGEIKKYLKYINTSAHRLDDSIITLARVSDIKNFLPARDKIYFNETVGTVIGNLACMHQTEKISVEKNIIQQNEFFSDRKCIELLLTALLSNSFKYHRAQEHSFVRINITAGDASAAIEVEDNGQGIPLEGKEKIFDMFYRGNPHSTGSGLGLYLVRNIIEKLKGQVDFQTEYGRGSKFTVVIPNYLAGSKES